jgi:hypothetical protein
MLAVSPMNIDSPMLVLGLLTAISLVLLLFYFWSDQVWALWVWLWA